MTLLCWPLVECSRDWIASLIRTRGNRDRKWRRKWASRLLSGKECNESPQWLVRPVVRSTKELLRRNCIFRGKQRVQWRSGTRMGIWGSRFLNSERRMNVEIIFLRGMAAVVEKYLSASIIYRTWTVRSSESDSKERKKFGRHESMTCVEISVVEDADEWRKNDT